MLLSEWSEQYKNISPREEIPMYASPDLHAIKLWQVLPSVLTPLRLEGRRWKRKRILVVAAFRTLIGASRT